MQKNLQLPHSHIATHCWRHTVQAQFDGFKGQRKSRKYEAIVHQALTLMLTLTLIGRLMSIIKGLVFISDQFDMVPCISACHESH